MSACSLVFPFQLFDPHPAISRTRPVVLIEDGLIFGDRAVELRFHQQKMVLHRASMKEYSARLKRRGYEVIYREFEPQRAVGWHLGTLGKQFTEFHLCDPVDFLLEKRLRRFAELAGARLVILETPMFLTPPEWAAKHFQGGRKPFMARFYQEQRKRLNILIDGAGAPAGGRWTYDEENRRPMPKSGMVFPPEPAAERTESVREAIAYVKRQFPDYFGDAERFAYPVTHEAAAGWLDRFFEQRFARFGDYEDAISREERVLFHGVLTPMLNTGLLTPRHVLDRALEFAAEHRVPLNSLEGFVRQIIGWREFMRAAYVHVGVRSRNSNFWNFEDRLLPRCFYNGSTGIDPVDRSIRRVLDHGYCHHIERLMVLGNFMLLCGFHPARVYNWFMELTVDAYDWVMVPNVFAMSQFAAGGLITTKPYLSSSNYVRKMSDYPKGAWCETWDGLFWMFIQSHREFFRGQHRLGMLVNQLDRMKMDRLRTHQRLAEQFLESLGV